MENEDEHNISAVYDSVAVVIPALNEEESLPLVLGDLPQVARVVVVDNGSTDDTAKLAAELGATVIPEAQRGYGKACLTGLARWLVRSIKRI